MAEGTTLESALTETIASGRKLLVPFVTAGYPDMPTTVSVMRGMAQIGVDAIELGVPFSDPLADGPTIAAASEAALDAGASLPGVLAVGTELGVGDQDPALVLFTYLNPVDTYGVERLASDARSSGVSAVLIADLPFDENPEIEHALSTTGVCFIRLAAPTTPPARLRKLAADARGFIYLIARTGVTGTGSGTDDRTATQVAILREETEVPIVVGFGIADVDAARRAADIADGVVIGTAFVEKLGTEGVSAALDWLATIRDGLDRG